MNSITLLHPYIIDNIYDFFATQPASRKAFGNTCRQFRAITFENEKYLITQQYISKNYLVCITNLNNLPTWRQLKTTRVILVGEIHIDLHHKKFAALTHLIWEKNIWALLAEGPGKHLLGTGQIKYLRSEIAETHESWDIQDRVLFDQVADSLQKILKVTKSFLIMRDECNLEQKIKMIENFLNFSRGPLEFFQSPSEERREIYKSLDDLQCSFSLHEFTAEEKTSKRLYQDMETISILTQICLMTFKLNIQYAKEFEKIVDESLLERDQTMVANIEHHLATGKKVLVNAGSHHVIQRENSPSDLLQKRKIPFLSLIPMQQEEERIKAFECISPRTKLKECSPDSITGGDLYYYTAQVSNIMIQELQACTEEAVNASRMFVECCQHRKILLKNLYWSLDNLEKRDLELQKFYSEKSENYSQTPLIIDVNQFQKIKICGKIVNLDEIALYKYGFEEEGETDSSEIIDIDECIKSKRELPVRVKKMRISFRMAFQYVLNKIEQFSHSSDRAIRFDDSNIIFLLTFIDFISQNPQTDEPRITWLDVIFLLLKEKNYVFDIKIKKISWLEKSYFLQV